MLMGTATLDSILKSREITFLKPVLGFEKCKSFYFQEYKAGSPFVWMIATTDETLKFVAINMFDFFPDYELNLSKDDREMAGNENSDILVFGLVTIPEKIDEMTVNMVAPIVVNHKKSAGGQFVNLKEGYSLREPLIK
jgi:flagellar assembly factor FliW